MKKTVKFLTSIILCVLVTLLSVMVIGCQQSKPKQEDPVPQPPEEVYYSITDATQVKKGTLTWTADDMKDGTVKEGSSVTFTITPSTGYEAVFVLVNMQNVTSSLSNNVFVIENVTKDLSVVISYKKLAYTLDVQTPTNGSVEVEGVSEYGEEITLTPKPDKGYKLKTLTVDGVDVTNLVIDNSYKFTIYKNTVVSCEFERSQFTVTVASSKNGQVILETDTYDYGDTVTVSIKPNEGYRPTVITLNGKPQTLTGNTFTFTITEDVEIMCGFTTLRYVVSALDVKNGMIRIDNGNPSKFDTVTITFIPSNGYELVGATANGLNLTVENNQATLSNITEDIEIGATFDFSEVTLTGYVEYEDGARAKGMNVKIGDDTVVTNNEGKYTYTAPRADYIAKVDTSEFYSNKISVSPQAPYSLLDTLILKKRKVGVNSYGLNSTGNSKVTHEYDESTQSEKITTSITFNGAPMYLDGMQSENGVVYFSIKNITDMSIDKYETDPGIGIYLKSVNTSTSYITHIVGKTTRYLKNASWSNVPYSGSSTVYNIHNINEKYYFAFVKQGNTVSYYVQNNGKYEFVGSYTDNGLNGEFYFAFIASTNQSVFTHSTVEINDISFSCDINDVDALIKANIETSIDGGVLSYDDDRMYIARTATFRITPNEGKKLSSLLVNGTAITPTYTAFDDYMFSYKITSKNVSVEAKFEDGEEVTGFSDGYMGTHNYDTSLYYRNDQDLFGADPGAIYVSIEDDPVYGGWFYMAVTGNNAESTTAVYGAYPIYRSKNLIEWEQCGAVGGCALAIDPTKDWALNAFWAPELLQETIEVNGVKKNRYYIYFSARSRVGNANTEYTSKTGTDWDRLYIGIGVSDCPYGPYTMVDTNNYYEFYGDKTTKVNKNGNAVTRNTPAFNFYRYNPEIAEAYKAKNITADFWPAIDISPFVDPATGDMYCYFSQHVSSVSTGNVIWVVKMKDYITPDYSTMHVVSIPGYSVKSLDFKTYVNSGINYGTNSATKNKVTRYAFDGNANGGGVNEGAFTIAHYDEVNKQWLYYLTYSPYGYGNRGYSICQAVSTSPYGPFTKLNPNKGFTVVGIVNMNSAGSGNGNIDYNMSKDYSASIDYMAGTGHHSFVKAGDEIFAVYHSFPNPISNYDQNGSFMGRCISVDRVQFVTSQALKYSDLDSSSSTAPLPVLYGNGPTYSAQPLPEVVSGYENIADEAIITYTNANATGKQYLNDGLYVTHKVYKDWEYVTDSEDVITLEFSSARSVRSVMVYNSAQYNYALKKVRSITLTLADGSKLTYNNLTQNADNCNTLKKVMRYGGSVIADFDEISVKKIEITVNSQDKYNTANTTIRIGDIVVLARVEKEKKDFEFRSANDTASEFIVDGVANDKEWSGKNWYVYDNGLFSVQATATMGKEGVFVTATIYDKYLFHMASGGHDPKFEGMHRWYKNTYLRTYMYVGDVNKYGNAMLKSVRTSAYEVESSHRVTANMSFVGDVNSGNSYSYTVEAYFPFSSFGVTSAQEAYLAFEYQRPVANNEINPIKYVIGDVDLTNISTFIKLNKNGYVSGFNSTFGNGNKGSSVLGGWTNITKTGIESTAINPSKVYLSDVYGNDLVATTTISTKAGSYKAKAGFVITTSNVEKSYILDLSYLEDGKKLSRIAIYSLFYGRKDLVYDDLGKATDAYLDNTTLKLVKIGDEIALFVNGKFVYSESDVRLLGNAEIGLYSEGASISFASVSCNLDKTQAIKEVQNIYSVNEFSHYALRVNAGFINTDKLYLYVRPVVVASGYELSAININGNDYTDKIENGQLLVEYADKKDAVIRVEAKSATVVKVLGNLTVDGFKASNVAVKFVSSNGYSLEIIKDASYSVSLPAGTYSVYTSSSDRGCTVASLSVTTETTVNLAVPSRLLGGSATVNGKTHYSSNTYALNNAGTVASAKDVGLGAVIFTGVSSDCAVIEFTSECFLNPASLPEGAKYEQDATVSVFFANETKASSVGYHGTSSRVRTDTAGSWATHTKQPVSNVLPKNLSAYGTVQKFLCIYLDNTWHMYFEKDGEYVFAYKYAFEEGVSATGKCVFGLSISTSYIYTRIRFKDVSIETDKTYVQETLAKLQNQ